MFFVPTHARRSAVAGHQRVRRARVFRAAIEPLEPRQLLAADPVISEFMASNQKTLKDIDDDYPDWIEIHNRGNAVADLTGWYLTDEKDNKNKWRFPAQTLATGGYLVVFASNKDRAIAGQQLHANFELKASGEYLALVQPDGTTIQSEYDPYPGQNIDTSYGLEPGGNDSVYFTSATPNAPNQLISSIPTFSETGRTFTGSILLTLGTDHPNAQIRYTTNRAAPTTTSTLYTGPISISNTTIVRTRVFESGLAPGPIVSQSFIALDTTVQSFRSNLPVVVIDSFGRSPGDTSLTAVTAAFIDTGADGYADFTDPVDFAGRGGFRYRGQSSQGFPKAPYALETWDENDKDKAVSILGMPAEADWILYDPYSEKSLMQNYLAYMWSNRMGQYAVRTRYVELFVNTDSAGKINYASDYLGVYIFMERIERDPNRVNIAQLTPQDNAEPDITGGYIFKKDKFDGTPDERSFTTSRGQTLLYVEPQGNEITTAQQAYLKSHINSFEAALYGASFKDPVNGYAKYIDVASWIDNWIMVELSKNIDGFRLSTYWYKDRGGKIVMGPIWDYNLSLGNADYYGGQFPTGWYSDQLGDGDYPYWRRLFEDPDFKQRLIDRWQELRQDEFATARLTGDVDELVRLLSDGNGNYPVGANPVQNPTNPVVRNFTKWKILGTYVWPNGYWSDASWIGNVNWMKSWITQRLAWIDSQWLAPPQFSQPGRLLTVPIQVSISNPGNKAVYYTLDGSDPRLAGGAINPKAKLYQGAIAINQSTRIRARVYANSAWSGLVEDAYWFEDGVRITELMYHPVDPPQATPPSPYIDEDFEFIELRNSGAKPVNLKGYRFTNAIEFTFPDLLVDPGRRAVLARNPGAFRSRYGSLITVVGPYLGSLENNGEKIRLEGVVGQPIQEFTYNNWYDITDGQGFSLVPIDPMASTIVLSTKAGWRPSDKPGGTPGADDSGLLDDAIVINEIYNGSAPGDDWVEIYNTTNSDIDLTGWFLSNTDQDLVRYRVPAQLAAVVPAHGFFVFTEADMGFGFSDRGDHFHLSSHYNGQLGGYRESKDFGPIDPGVTFVRYTKSTGKSDFVASVNPTRGLPNADPRVGPVVINEIMYNPGTLGGDEYIELKNITGSPVKLYDSLYPENGWKFTSGLNSFAFRNGDQIAAYGYAMVVGIDRDLFRTRYNIPAAVPVFGPYNAVLKGSGEAIELARPASPQTDGFVPYIVVERVKYNDGLPWPTEPDGNGPSLARIDSTKYGNDPMNWTIEANGGSPGGAPTEKVPPVPTIVPVNPNPRNEPVPSITVSFSEPVTGFDIDIADLKLTRNGMTIALAGATLTDSGDGQTYTLGNLDKLTWRQGSYAIKLTAAASGVKDLYNNMMIADASASFTISTNAIGGLPNANNSFFIQVLGNSLQIFLNVAPNPTPTFSVPLAEIAALTILGGSGDDTLDILSALAFSPVFSGGGGSNRLNLSAGSYALDADANGLKIAVAGSNPDSPTRLLLNSSQHLNLLSISGQAIVSVSPSATKTLTTASLSFSGNGMLDLADNDLILTDPAAYESLVAYIRSGRNAPGGLWTGPGIQTSFATAVTGLGLGSIGSGFLVKHTYSGDANLDGIVNADDYFRIDSGFISQSKGYHNGDLNYDQVINADDYFLIDYAFLTQKAPLAASSPSPAAADTVYSSARASAAGGAPQRKSAYAELFSTEPLSVL